MSREYSRGDVCEKILENSPVGWTNISFQLMGPEGTAGPVPREGQAGCQGQVLPPEGFGPLTRLQENGHTASALPLKERVKEKGKRDGGKGSEGGK